VRDVVASVGAMAEETNVTLKEDATDDPCTLTGDSVQVTRAIQNVIINAMQASGDKKGSVEVNCIRKDFYVDVRIADTGHGISPEQVAKIFDPYFTTKQGKSGTGLGLYITKKVVEDHNGSIKVDSTPDVGTTITIRLPLEH
ncbi:MAG: sensor histidine kinase, partial [Chthoniobacterales bacterium]